MATDMDCIKVAVRCRPLRPFEVERGAVDNVFQAFGKEAVLNDPNAPDAPPRRFAFDFVYDGTSTQDQVYQDNVTPLLDKAFAGFNATVFAYGQTGAGKSWTMSGNAQHPGIIPRMSSELFQKIEALKADYAAQGKERHFMVEASFFEIYNEQVFDLLVPKTKAGAKRKNLMLRETKAKGVYVDGLNELVVKSEQEIADIISQGNTNRSVGSTSMNAESSRSHSIFTLKIHQREAVEAAGGKEIKIYSKINLVDLAGSERSSKTNATGARLKEGANINKSLTTLGTVINTLAKNAGSSKKPDFVPYRNSKLTRVLQESLGGNSLTVMIAALSPASDNLSETLSTLKYADRAKAIKLAAVKNDNSEQVAKLLNQIEELKKQLAEGGMDEAKKREMEEKFAREKEEMARQAQEAWAEKERQTQEFERRRQQLAEKAREAEESQKQQALAERKRRLGVVATKNDLSLTMEEMPGPCPSLAALAARVEALGVQLRDQVLTLNLYRENFAKDVQRWPTSNASPTTLRLDRLRGTFSMLREAIVGVSTLQSSHSEAAVELAALLDRVLIRLQQSQAAIDPIEGEQGEAQSDSSSAASGEVDGLDQWVVEVCVPIKPLQEEQIQALSQSEAEDLTQKDRMAREQRTAKLIDAIEVLGLLQSQLVTKREAVAETFASNEVTAVAEIDVLRRLGDVGQAESAGLTALVEEQQAHCKSLHDVANSVDNSEAKADLQAKAKAAADELEKHREKAEALKVELHTETAKLSAILGPSGATPTPQDGAAKTTVSTVDTVVKCMGKAIDWRLSVQESLAEQSQEQLLQSKENMITSLQKELGDANKLIQQLTTDVAQLHDKLNRKDAHITEVTAAQHEAQQMLADAKRAAQGAAAERDAVIEEYREREADLLEDKARSSTQISDLREALESASDRNDRQAAEVNELRGAAEALRKENFDLTVQLDAAKKATSDANAAHKQKANELKLEVKQQAQQLELLKEERDKAAATSSARVAALEEEKQAQVAAEREEKWKMKEALDKLQREAAQQDGDTGKMVEELQQRVTELEKAAETASAAVAAAEVSKNEQVGSLEAQLAEAQLAVKAEQDKATLQDSKYKKLLSKSKKASKQLKELQEQLEAASAAQRALEAASHDAAEQARTLEQKAAAEAEKAEEFEARRAEHTAQVNELRKDAAAVRAELKLAQLEVENHKQAVDQKELERKQAVADLKQVEADCEAKLQQVEDRMEEYKEAERKALEAVARMESEVKRAQVFNYKLVKAVEMSDKSQGGIGATEVMRLENKASRLEAQFERAEAERVRLEKVEKAFHEQKLELGAARISARKLESQIDDLEGQVYALTEEKDEARAKAARKVEALQAAAAKVKEDHEYELEQLADEITELKDQLKNKTAEINAARLELSNAAQAAVGAATHAAGSALQAARRNASPARQGMNTTTGTQDTTTLETGSAHEQNSRDGGGGGGEAEDEEDYGFDDFEESR